MDARDLSTWAPPQSARHSGEEEGLVSAGAGAAGAAVVVAVHLGGGH